MLNNAASREQVSASQIVRSSNRMGLGVRRSQAVSSHRADKNGSRFDGHEFSKISSIRSGRSRLRRLLKLGGRNEHDDGKRYQSEHCWDLTSIPPQPAIFLQEKKRRTRYYRQAHLRLQVLLRSQNFGACSRLASRYLEHLRVR